MIGVSEVLVLMEAESSFQASVNFYETTWSKIPEDSILHVNPKSILTLLFM
jgi:hypothetical protein